MIKKALFLTLFSIALISCESESFDTTTTSGTEVTIDDQVSTICVEPKGLSTEDVTNETVNVIWEQDAIYKEQSWEVRYQKLDDNIAKNDEPIVGEEGNILNVGSNNVEIKKLESRTTYNVYVRSRCNLDTYSEWAGPIQITTL
ncbi:fibronectin type III domain-containing protein [Aquimarina hainanensis]|uniref:Fibronectin type III domain-containing protein n=1 Tax=Aquimarina hainanensis TaxID=1578017 RepID=A0ABW5N3E2_9FLAO|nr:fibronectin type III domain-containing protein [Aquimarina sp. TRL1]QKX04366.1 fibronectin type III domain-containing protein [Aquimarina sp. TRL1]